MFSAIALSHSPNAKYRNEMRLTAAFVADVCSLICFTVLAALGNHYVLPRGIGRCFTALASLQGVALLATALAIRKCLPQPIKSF